MLNYLYSNIRDNKIVKKLNQFLYSNFYIIFINILMLVSYFFNIEIIIYYIYMVLGILIMLLCDDMLPTVPMFCTGYMTISKINSPIVNVASLLYSKTFLVNIIILGTITGAFLIARLVFSLKYNKKTTKPKLTFGFIAFTFVMVIGGVFTKYYGIKTILYGLLVGITLSFCYFYFFYTINFEKVRTDYIFYTFMVIGIAVGLELLDSYFSFEWGSLVFHRDQIYTGWGIHNNIGGIICTCIGAGFYLSTEKKHSAFYTLCGVITYGLTILSQSRNAMGVGLLLLIASIVLTFVYNDRAGRRRNLIIHLLHFFILLVIVLIYKDKVITIFVDIIEKGIDDNGRFEMYRNGLSAYVSSPIIGTGFFDYDHGISVFFKENSFLAPRYHNTIIQIMASTGTIGLIGYGYHRYETFKMFFKNCSKEKIFLAMLLVAIIGTSLLDCQLFNFGPGLHYGTLLVFMECLPSKKEKIKEQII